jgi:hypothetical protein
LSPASNTCGTWPNVQPLPLRVNTHTTSKRSSGQDDGGLVALAELLVQRHCRFRGQLCDRLAHAQVLAAAVVHGEQRGGHANLGATTEEAGQRAGTLCRREFLR